MYRGTTPTITINCDIDVSEFVTMWVTFRTQQLATYAPPKQVEVTKHLGDEGVDAYIRTGVTALGANWLSKTSGGAALTPESDKIYVILSEGEYQNKTYR